MAKKICLTDDDIREMLENACKSVKKQKFQSGDVHISVPITRDKRRAELFFTPIAWSKMYALVHGFTTEVEWHGTVERLSESQFLVKDILTFPHEVTGATVTSNQKEYEEWQDSLDDETFNALRFHGHSHVNMGVTPSGTDMEYRRKVLNNFCVPTDEDDFFYIFLITNKKGNLSAEIYDLKNNALYGTDEIEIDVQDPDDDFVDAVADKIDEAVASFLEDLNADTLAAVDDKGRLSFTIKVDIDTGDGSTLGDFIKDAHKIIKEPKTTWGGYNKGSQFKGYGDSAGFDTGSRSLNKKKNETKGQVSIDDYDDDDDPYSDSWLARMYGK